MKVWKYDWEVGWYQVIEEWVTLKLVTFKPTKIEDVERFT